MTKEEFTFTHQLMQEMGLEEGERRRIVDQDTGEICCFKNKDLLVPGSQSGKNSVEFDPLNNPRIMDPLFMEFIDKLEEEGEIDGSCISYGVFDDGNGALKARLTMSDGSHIQSNSYKNEALCFADLVHRINGDEDVDFSKYDVDRRKPSNVKTPTKQKKTSAKKAKERPKQTKG